MTPHFIDSAVFVVMPMLGNWCRLHQGTLFLCSFVIVFFLLHLSAQQTDDLERLLGEAVRDALRFARITEEQAADMMRMNDSHLRKALRGEPSHHISLTRLVRLPYVFWLYFSPTLIYLVARRNTEQIAEDLGVRRPA